MTMNTNTTKNLTLYTSSKLNPNNSSIKSNSNNSTCPLPPPQQDKSGGATGSTKAPQYQLSRDLTNLYELFTSVPTTTPNNKNNVTYYYNDNLVCFCCEREIVSKRRKDSISTIVNSSTEEERKRKLDEFITKNKITTALFYGSNQVRKYMKKVMTRENWNDVLKQGFPCPHLALWNKEDGGNNKKRISNNSHYFCTLCDTDQTQHTLRLTLTPSSCRAQDKEIYGEYKQLQKLDDKKSKKRRGMLHLG